MASTVTSQEVIHHGWTYVSYDDQLNCSQAFVIGSKDDFPWIAKKIGLIGSDLEELKT